MNKQIFWVKQFNKKKIRPNKLREKLPLVYCKYWTRNWRIIIKINIRIQGSDKDPHHPNFPVMNNVYLNDEEAVKDLAEGNEKAFRFLFERYFFWVGRIGMKYLQDLRLSQDLVQDIFSVVWMNRMRFREVDHFESYLYIMTKNLALQYLKKIGKEVLARQEFALQKQAGENNTEDYLNEKEYAELINEAVEKLRPQQKQIFELGKHQGLSHRRIAQELEISQQTVSNQMSLALKSIKAHLKSHIVSLAPLLLYSTWF
jgi:RNA polymerase sigma-70 factor (family 1)